MTVKISKSHKRIRKESIVGPLIKLKMNHKKTALHTDLVHTKSWYEHYNAKNVLFSYFSMKVIKP